MKEKTKTCIMAFIGIFVYTVFILSFFCYCTKCAEKEKTKQLTDYAEEAISEPTRECTEYETECITEPTE